MTSGPDVPLDESQIYAMVQESYSAAVKDHNGEHAHKVATAFGYSEKQLASIPKDANLGLSCGNPLVLAQLREAETVVDLGSGAGFDIFLAAKKVGPQGKAIGVDMNKDMLDRAERNKEKSGFENVSFVESRITEVRLPDAIADCIISNCVVNLVPEGQKQLVFNEMYRLLKPGGRVAISDMLARKDLSPELKRDMVLYVGCIAGASQVKDYEVYLRKAGFDEILIVDANNDLNVYKRKVAQPLSQCSDTDAASPCCQTSSCWNSWDAGCTSKAKRSDLNQLDFNELAGSFKIYAVKG
ncbi:hypothetical protein G647_02208 [Cladophialophora carrionii CBS 160.54]|uniref:Arsenite methyltransferase n=1 Tax=Cladophialophora carrionii CBS 160.54 TaxID=1279043 RepID=V9DF08_9EURO|nr:uncharacterized protein G647_02208 [Cladophialophora carrionii CBS 160.54]ETI25435.1 hypothetical protein G647_02208 [Cladophialophora carrionii CBS 160.54]